MASKDTTNLVSDSAPGRAQLADGLKADDPAAGTVLDYLWITAPEGEPASASAPPPACASEESQYADAPETMGLESTLKRYNHWLDSIATD